MSTTATRSAPSSQRILQKLRDRLEANDFYEAHQIYRTLYFRYLSQKRYQELEDMLLESALSFLQKNQTNSGADLALLYLETVKNDPRVKENFKNEANSSKFAQDVCKMFDHIPAESPERMNFLLKVSKLDEDVFPVAQVHHLIALSLWHKENNFPGAKYHFFNSARYQQLDAANMLIELQTKQGKEDEVDVFIAQFVLQLLGRVKRADVPKVDQTAGQEISANDLTNPKNPQDVSLQTVKPRGPQHEYGIRIFSEYTKVHPAIQASLPPYKTPLLNFIHFLLILIQAGKAESFLALRNVYSTSLACDETFDACLDKIGKSYFGVPTKSKNTQMGLFGNLINQLMGGEDTDGSDNEADAGNASRAQFPSGNSRNVPQEVLRRLESRGLTSQSGASASSASSLSTKQTQQQQLDLD